MSDSTQGETYNVSHGETSNLTAESSNASEDLANISERRHLPGDASQCDDSLIKEYVNEYSNKRWIPTEDDRQQVLNFINHKEIQIPFDRAQLDTIRDYAVSCGAPSSAALLEFITDYLINSNQHLKNEGTAKLIDRTVTSPKVLEQDDTKNDNTIRQRDGSVVPGKYTIHNGHLTEMIDRIVTELVGVGHSVKVEQLSYEQTIGIPLTWQSLWSFHSNDYLACAREFQDQAVRNTSPDFFIASPGNVRGQTDAALIWMKAILPKVVQDAVMATRRITDKNEINDPIAFIEKMTKHHIQSYHSHLKNGLIDTRDGINYLTVGLNWDDVSKVTMSLSKRDTFERTEPLHFPDIPPPGTKTHMSGRWIKRPSRQGSYMD